MSDEIGRRRAAWDDLKATVGCSLTEARRLAEEAAVRRDGECKMTVIARNGAILETTWLDPHMGLIRVKGENGFIMDRDLQKYDIWVLSMADGEGKSIPLRDASESTPG